MKFNYIVTFESQTEAPKAARGIVEGSGWPTAAQRAVKAARKDLPRLRASSICVVLEQNDGSNDFKL